ncbi:uncharacterized protein LOC124168881 [Ischnura elegans]|uniref:uncharacterized protein LOC124168881 n=1 Tax=Ischnura elegans TaxID=197161 RepID=UPI001ED8A6A6|nr:uncharacterized protein LOC124168881 [Ischnura elegans]XP_046403208.1 uncharacterized protein LOC124168881 [Ischnura elegans]XP_046403209.1 uncharacterized protein LOC124168881 [Ischnura elegans]XP_046403210.1 uncharacterized protein LOC124168881 [Ischnura elegans]
MSRSENERFCSTGSRGLLPRRGDESPLLPELQGPQPAVVPSSNRRTPIATGLVRFRVGKEPEVQEFDAQKEVLANANEVLFASFNGYMPDSSEDVICISDADPRAFENFLRFLERKDVNFRSTTTAVLTLYIANKYMEPRLAIHCLNYLNNKLSTESALELLMYNSLLCHDHRGSNGMLYGSTPGSPLFGDHGTQTSPLPSPYHSAYLPPRSFEDGSSSPPCLEDAVTAQQNEANGRLVSGSRGSIRSIRPPASAPSDNEIKRDEMKTMWKKAWYLQHNCYQWVDCNADEILSSETAESFDEQVLSHIISRPTLGVSSETKVVDLLKRWSTSECRRKGLAVTNENLMLCLGDLRFKARYLQMETEEFLLGYKPTKGSQVKDASPSSPEECTAPAFSGLLTQEESRWILDRIRRSHRGQSAGQDCIKPPPEPPSLSPWISSMETPREPPARDFLTLDGKPVGSRDGKAKRKGGSMESSSVRSKLRAALTLGWRKSRRRRDEVIVVKEKARNADDGGRKRSKDSGTGRRCSGSCFAEYFFTALSCFFD